MKRRTPHRWALGLAILAISSVSVAQKADWTLTNGWLARPGVGAPGDGPPVNLRLAEGGWLLDAGTLPVPEFRFLDDGSMEAVYTASRGILTDRYEPFAALGTDAWRRSVRYTNASDAEQDLLEADLRLSPTPVPCGVVWDPEPFRMAEVADGRALCMAYWTVGDPYSIEPLGAVWKVRVEAQWRLRPGEEAVIGHQTLWLGTAGREAFREEARRYYRAMGFVEPLTYPEWLTRGVLYEVSAGGHIDSRFSDVGGFRNLIHQLDYLADLGVTAFWLNAVQSHKTPPNPVEGGWNHYDPRDFTKVDSILGGADGLEALADAMRERGIHFIGEVVPHGGHSIQAEALDTWWTRTREGEPARPWGGYGMDNASPAWQAAIRESMAMLATGFGIEGARIDVADGQGANWGSPRTNHASYSALGGGFEMLGAIRDGIAAGPMKTPVLIPETWLDRAEYYAVKNAAVLGYGMKTTWQFGYALNFDLSDAARINDVLRTYFERERGSLPPGALALRTLNNHDTVCDLGSVQQRFGAGLARALYGVCLSVPGVPMMYQEEEIGSFDALRCLNWARRALPELGAGDADYLSVQAPPEVFSVLRSLENNRTLCLVNLSGKTVEAAYTVPGCDANTVYDAVSGLSAKMDAGQFRWTLAPYASAFLRISEAPEIVMPEPRWSGETGTFSPTPSPFAVEVTPDGFTVRQGRLSAEFAIEGDWVKSDGSDGSVRSVRFRSAFGAIDLRVEAGAVSVACDLNTSAPAPVLRVRHAAQWQVSGRTAMLSDRTLRRHFPFPEGSDYVWRRGDGWGAGPWGSPYNGMAPTGRLWQTLFEPLHPEQPALAFSDADGAGFAVTDIATDAMNVVLTDCTDEVNPDPYRLELRFLAVDTDLSPRVRAVGLGQFWEFETPAPDVRRPLKVSFRIAPFDVLADTSLLPVAQSSVVEMRDGDMYTEGSHAVFTIKPGRIAWSELTPVDGIYRVGLELRHSEAAGDKTEMADKYVVEIDGVPQPLEWTTLNTHTYGNAYFGVAYTPPIDLRGKSHTIAVTTKADWCAVRKRFLLRTP